MNDQLALLNTDQVAKLLGLSPRTLECFRVNGRGPEFVKMGHAVRYTVAKLNDWLEACTRTSTSDDGRASKKKREK